MITTTARAELVLIEAAEIDEQWSFVRKKSNQRWRWHRTDHVTGKVLAYFFAAKNKVFSNCKRYLILLMSVFFMQMIGESMNETLKATTSKRKSQYSKNRAEEP